MFKPVCGRRLDSLISPSPTPGGLDTPDEILFALDAGAKEAVRVCGFSHTVITDGHSAVKGISVDLDDHGEIHVRANLRAVAKHLAYARRDAPQLNTLAAAEQAAGSLVLGLMGYSEICPYERLFESAIYEACLQALRESDPGNRNINRAATSLTMFFSIAQSAAVFDRLERGAFVDGLIINQVCAERDHWTNLLALLRAMVDTFDTTPLPTLPLPKVCVWADESRTLAPTAARILWNSRLRYAGSQLVSVGSAERLRPAHWGDAAYDFARWWGSEHTPNAEYCGFRPQLMGARRSMLIPIQGRQGGEARPDMPPHPNVLDALEKYYETQAVCIEIRTREKKRRPDDGTKTRMQVGHLTVEPVGPQSLVGRSIAWPLTRPVILNFPNRFPLSFQQRTFPLLISEPEREPARLNPPHLLICLDSSQSLTFNPASHDAKRRGAFDVLLRCVFSLLHTAETCRQGTQSVEVAGVNFSDRTNHATWSSPRSRRLRHCLLSKQNGGTVLDPTVLERLGNCAPGNYLVVVLTDGLIRNHTDVEKTLQAMASNGAEVVVFHVGVDNAFTDAAQSFAEVKVVKSVNDLMDLTLELARDRFDARNKGANRA